MSIKNGLLALLERGPAYGYQLRSSFEESTGAAWPLNIGQVYTTLARLERDKLVRALPENDQGQRPYAITDAGRATVAVWFTSPVSNNDRPRDELAIKLALSLTTPGVDVASVIRAQRVATTRSIQEYTRLKQQTGDADMAWRLIVESMICRAEAEIKWLDHAKDVLIDRAGDNPR